MGGKVTLKLILKVVQSNEIKYLKHCFVNFESQEQRKYSKNLPFPYEFTNNYYVPIKCISLVT